MPAQTTNPMLQLLVPYAIIFLIFYLLVFKPRKKEQDERKNLLSNLKKNDEIVTSGGIHGTIVNVKEKTVVIRIDDTVKMEVDKEAIAALTKQSETTLAK